MATEKPIVAAFDFDGTLTYRDTLLPFLISAVGPFSCFLNLIPCLPTLLAYCIGAVSRQKTKETVLTQFFAGMPLEEIRKKGELFAEKRLNHHVKPEAYRRFLWHKEKGHRCILVSASIDVYLAPWAAAQGFETVLTSRLETDEKGCFTGNLLGLNCWGPEKTRRLEELLGPRSGYQMYAYGDSRGDKEMLASADHSYFRKIPILEGCNDSH